MEAWKRRRDKAAQRIPAARRDYLYHAIIDYRTRNNRHSPRGEGGKIARSLSGVPKIIETRERVP